MTALDCGSPKAIVLAYLERELDGERLFVKSHHIASECDISAKEAGQALRSLAAGTSRFDIESWGGSSDGTTWLVERPVE